MAIQDLTSSQIDALVGTRHAAVGMEYPPAGLQPYYQWLVRSLHHLAESALGAMQVRADDAGDAVVRIAPGRVTLGGVVLSYAGGTLDLTSAGTGTALVWVVNSGGSASVNWGISGSGWPVAAHLKLAEVTLVSGMVTAIVDRRIDQILHDLSSVGGGVSGDVVGPASATDSAVARFSGTTGKLIANSACLIDDSGNVISGGNISASGSVSAASASISGAVSAGSSAALGEVSGVGSSAWLSAGGSASDVSLRLVCKGNGALYAGPVVDSTTTGGNARGSNAVDWQTDRDAATKVASGARSVVLGGRRNTASNNYALAGGDSCLASGWAAVALGQSCTASGANAVALGSANVASATGACATGSSNTASANASTACGGSNNVASAVNAVTLGGARALADLQGKLANANDRFASDGDAQQSWTVLRGTSTSATPVELSLNGAAPTSGNRYLIRSNHTYGLEITLVARQATGAAEALFVRRVLIENNSGTTALVGSVQTIGTDIGSNAGAPPAGWSVGITADNTNDCLAISVTGDSNTIRWVAKVEAVEVGHG